MNKVKNTETIIEETVRESIINRPHNDAGSIKRVKKERFKITQDKIELAETNVVPALLKLFMESLDNPIDVAIKGGCTKIDIKVDPKSIQITDNGYGIDTGTDKNGEHILYKAFCKYNTSANYAKDVKGKGQKGVNGKGIKLCTTLSTHFTVTSDDGHGKVTIKGTENNLNHKITENPSSGKTGLTFKFYPDFNIFDAEEIDQEHIDRMFEYTLIQALTYPNITFKFNGKMVKYTPKKFISLLGEHAVIEQTEDYFFAVLPNKEDDFKQISFVNGLETSRGGTHIDFLIDKIVPAVREKLMKKHKGMKPGDVKNKIQIVLIAKNMRDVDWDGQTKESISSPMRNMSEYFKGTDFTKFVTKVLGSSEIIDPITEIFKLKEEAKKNLELKALGKTKKKIKSEKYLPATGRRKYLLITEGASATGGLMPVLGREECGFYELKGKPLNAVKASQGDFTKNKELSELYQIIVNEGYEYIAQATDQDLDGFHIRGLLLGFNLKYTPQYIGKIGKLDTPVIGVKKNGKLVRWYYSLNDEVILKAGETSKYYKGLGSWREEDLTVIVETDGLEKMFDIFEFDDKDIIDDWLNPDKSDIRKSYIQNNEFSIAKL